MELRHLRYFVEVAERLSFSAAAESLHIAQPPLSQQIRDLEREIGTVLFDRSKRRIAMTQAGREFLADSRNALKCVADMQIRARRRSEGQLGQLAVGLNMAIISPSYFAPLLRTFGREHPEIKISLSDLPSLRQLEALHAGTIDIGFLRQPPQKFPDDIATHLIKREVTRLAVPVGHRFQERKKLAWEDLANEEFVLVNMAVARSYYEPFLFHCRRAGFEPRVAQYADNVSTQLWLVSAGIGVAPLPEVPILTDRGHSTGSVIFIPLPPDATVFKTIMAWRKNDPSPVLRRFVEFVRKMKSEEPTPKNS